MLFIILQSCDKFNLDRTEKPRAARAEVTLVRAIIDVEIVEVGELAQEVDLSQPIELDGQSYVPFMWASLYGQREVAELLIQRGVNVNAATQNGVTALMCVAEHGQIEVVRLLINRGAEVNAEDSIGRKAFTYAALHGRKEIARVLMQNGFISI